MQSRKSLNVLALVAVASVGLVLASVCCVGAVRVPANSPALPAAGSQQQVNTNQQQQQQQAPAQAPTLTGAQLFQSPAALAAIAAAAAQQPANLAVQQSPAAPAPPPPPVAANMLSPVLPAAMSPRVDSQELHKQAALAQAAAQQQPYNFEQECLASGGFTSFELITGYVLSAAAESMVMQPGTLQLTDCLNLCRQNASCLAINFETGLCVLLQESADKNPQALQKSQFPVFTIYAHKICIQGERANRCHKSWSFERVIGWVLSNLEKRTLLTKTRLECLLACYNEQSFQCKSFNYDSASGSCQLSDLDRHSLPSAAMRRRHYIESPVDTIDYGENNCAPEARGICDFKPMPNRILKTVDSIYQEVKSEAECRKRCLQAPYRCHSYDLGDSANPVCRTSHLDRNSLQQIQEPYLEIAGALSYELDSCYNVTVLCRSREMVARVRTNKLFSGKVYAKNAPLSCVNDVAGALDFELAMGFGDQCAVNKANAANGLFANEIVLQHNDMIVTNQDMGLNVRCQYELRNQTVYNNINLDDFMAGREPIDVASQSAVVRSPNISMQILRHDGAQIAQAQVGDSLMLRFAITDERSPYEIFVRDLYVMDGLGGSEIMLIDAEGCPTDPSIMGAMGKPAPAPHTLEAQFDAFKFPTSETVAFRALVTPCIPHCEPVHCQSRVFDGSLYEADSLGKRRRRRRRRRSATGDETPATGSGAASQRASATSEVLVRNSIEIRDKMFAGEEGARAGSDGDASGLAAAAAAAGEGPKWRGAALASLFGAMLLVQSALVLGWALSGGRSARRS